MSRETTSTYCSTIPPKQKPKARPIPNAEMAFSASSDEWNITVYGRTQTEADAKLVRSIERREKSGEFTKARYNGSINP